MNYGKIRKYDTANGPGIRATLFVSGCIHNCKGCFNKELQDFNYGKLFDKETKDSFISLSKNPLVAGVSILGGEPMHHAKDPSFLGLLHSLKFNVKKPVWLWTGYTYEEILKDEFKRKVLEFVDVLIDGRFDESKKNLMLKYRGSSNQRVIDVKKTIEANEIILLSGID